MTINDSPTRRMNVNVRFVDNEFIVLDRQSGLIHRLNRTAGYIWERCNGRSTTLDIASQLARDFEVPSDVATADTLSCVEQLQTLNLLKKDEVEEL